MANTPPCAGVFVGVRLAAAMRYRCPPADAPLARSRRVPARQGASAPRQPPAPSGEVQACLAGVRAASRTSSPGRGSRAEDSPSGRGGSILGWMLRHLLLAAVLSGACATPRAIAPSVSAVGPLRRSVGSDPWIGGLRPNVTAAGSGPVGSWPIGSIVTIASQMPATRSRSRAPRATWTPVGSTLRRSPRFVPRSNASATGASS